MNEIQPTSFATQVGVVLHSITWALIYWMIGAPWAAGAGAAFASWGVANAVPQFRFRFVASTIFLIVLGAILRRRT